MSIIAIVILDLVPSALILVDLLTESHSFSLPFGLRGFGAPADDTFVIWSFLMIITWTHSWETPNFSGHVPFCYSSRRRRDFMERVSGPLCADNDQTIFQEGGVGSSPRPLRLQNAGRGGSLPCWEDRSVMTTYNKEELKVPGTRSQERSEERPDSPDLQP